MVAKHVRRLSRKLFNCARTPPRKQKVQIGCFYTMYMYMCMYADFAGQAVCAYKIPQNNRSPRSNSSIFPSSLLFLCFPQFFFARRFRYLSLEFTRDAWEFHGHGLLIALWISNFSVRIVGSFTSTDSGIISYAVCGSINILVCLVFLENREIEVDLEVEK